LLVPGLQPLLPIAIGADIGAVTGGIRGANDPNVGFWKGAGRGAAVGALGGALSMAGGGTFVANVAWGMAEGAINGGLDAALWGNDVGEGMLYGAAIGGAFAFGQSTIESFKNLKDYNMFGTNDGVFNQMVDHSTNIVNGKTYVNEQRAQKALDFWTDRFGGPHMDYSDNTLISLSNNKTQVNSVTGKVEIGASKFLGGSGHVRRAIAHEHGHYYDDVVWLNNQVGGKALGRWHDNSGYYGGDGLLGYHHAIENSGKYHIPLSALIDSNQLTSYYSSSAWTNYALRSGKSGWLRYLYYIPRRF
jgi:hypothetical protein